VPQHWGFWGNARVGRRRGGELRGAAGRHAALARAARRLRIGRSGHRGSPRTERFSPRRRS
jgi:hypothetical protein